MLAWPRGPTERDIDEETSMSPGPRARESREGDEDDSAAAGSDGTDGAVGCGALYMAPS